MPTQVRPPNVVFVLTDDQGYGDLGCHGNPIIRTPRLDEFHGVSFRLTNYHVGPTCAPTRAGLMTGHYANSTGVWHTIGGRSLLRRNEWTIAEALRAGGYRTGIFGKWHLGDAYPYRPQDRGFDVSVVHGGGGISQTPDYWGNDYFDDTYAVNGVTQPFAGYCTDVFFREGLQFIEANRDRPFLCAITTNAAHSPYNVERRFSDLYRGRVPDDRARFSGMISCIDENFGLLRARLRQLELEDDTLLVFMTDNGSSGGARLDADGFVVEGFNAGMRGLKGSPYDGGHRVPCFLRWPGGGLTGGQDIDTLAANVDFMPTVLDLCGVPVPAERTFHGRSLVPLLRGAADAWEPRAVVTDSQRLANPVKWRMSAVMTDRWRLVNGEALYDMTIDGEQRHDVAAYHPEVVAELRGEYETWWQLVSPQFGEEIPLSLGADPAGETQLTCHDWHNENCDCPWNHSHIRQGTIANGYWEVLVERAGTYLIELRRWPREAHRPLVAGVEDNDIIWRQDVIAESDWGHYCGGKALPLTHAVLQVGDQTLAREIGPEDTAVEFTLELAAGPAHLQTWLTDGGDLQVGAYYVSVRRIDCQE